MTRMNPRALKDVSPATIITTPAVIVAMMRMSFMEIASRRNTKANVRTNASEEDLHMAGTGPVSIYRIESDNKTYCRRSG